MPYQPTVTNRTGEFLFRGITGAADSLADAVKQRKQQSQKASSLRKTIGIYNPELKDEVQTMGLADLEGYVAGIGMKAAKDKLAQDQSNKDREYNLSKVYADLQQGQMNRANERDAAGQRFTQSLASLMGTGGGPSMDFANTLAGEPQPARDVGLADIVQAAGQSGLTLEPTSLAQLLRAEQMGQRGNAGAELAFQEDPVTGARVATFGNSLIPTGTNPAKQQAQAVAVTDSEGNVIGQAIPGRNGMQLVRTPAKGVDPKTRVNAILAQLKVESNLPRRQKLTEELDGLLNGTAPAAAPTAAGAVNDPLGLFN
jgi:hypothetical protein